MSLLARRKVNRVKPPAKTARLKKVRVRRLPRLPDWRGALRPARYAATLGVIAAALAGAWQLLDRPVTTIAVTALVMRALAPPREEPPAANGAPRQEQPASCPACARPSRPCRGSTRCACAGAGRRRCWSR